MTKERNSVTAGISKLFVKGRMGNSLGSVGPMASVTMAQLYHRRSRQPWTADGHACSNRPFLTKQVRL